MAPGLPAIAMAKFDAKSRTTASRNRSSHVLSGGRAL